MRVAILSDLHVHDWREFSVIEGGLPSRLIHTVDVIGDVVSHCIKHGIGAIVIGGDLFHKRGVVHTLPYNLVVKQLVRAKQNDLTVLAIDGNHDHADKIGTIHPFEALEDSGLVQAVPVRDGYVNWNLSIGSDELVVSGFSYCDSRETFMRRLDASYKEVRNEYPNVHRIGVFHHGFKGARVGSALEYTVKEDIDSNDLRDRYEYLFSGHYHQRQWIGPEPEVGEGAMMYIGSPLEHVRGDGGMDKGFLVYDSEKRDWELVKLHRPRFTKLTQEDIDGDTSPKFVATVRGNFVDVHYEQLPPPMKWEEYAAYLIRVGAAGVKPVPVMKSKSTTAPRLAIDPSLEPKEILAKYLDYEEKKTVGLDRTELLRIGADLVSRAGIK